MENLRDNQNGVKVKIRLEIEVALSADTVAALDGWADVERSAMESAKSLFPARGVRLLRTQCLEVSE